MMVDGFLDGALGQVLHGWAWHPDDPATHCSVDIFVDGQLVARVRADRYRRDVAAAGIGAGDHAFTHRLDDWFADGKGHEILVQHSISRETIRNGRQQCVLAIPPAAEPAPAERRRKVRRVGSWLRRAARAATTRVIADRSIARAVDDAARHRRVAIAAMYMPSGRLWRYQRELLSSLRRLGFRVFLVHNSREASAAIHADASPCADLCVGRINEGLDFACWQMAVGWLRHALGALDELVLFNDSVFGPLHPLQTAFDRMAKNDADFWGITDSWEHAYHLQSYFLVFRQRALRHPAFLEFWDGYDRPKAKEQIIARGEIGLTRALMHAGLVPSVLCPYPELAARWVETIRPRMSELKDVLLADAGTADAFDALPQRAFDHYNYIATQLTAGVPINPSAYFWETLATQLAAPFFKRELVLRNPIGDPDPVRMVDVITRVSGYPADFIEEVRRDTPRNSTPPIVLTPSTPAARPPRAQVIDLRR